MDDNTYRVKIKTLFGYVYIRKNWKPLTFKTFQDVVIYVNGRKRKDQKKK
jgi:hypothetical protein